MDRSFDIETDLLAVSTLDGRFTSLNAAWSKLLGWSREELMAEPYAAFIHPDDIISSREERAKGVQADTHVLNFENRMRHKDGSYRWLRWSAHSDGELWFALAFDITEQKRAEEQIRTALRDGRLLAYSQPIVDFSTGKVVEEELLARLQGADGKAMLLPADFVPAAERYDLIGMVDVWMARQAVDLARAGRHPAVNLSTRSISDEALRAELVEIVESAGEAAANIVFEITESAAADNLDEILDFASRLAGLGCRLALDDFGTGYASLTYLRRLPIQKLKIDRSFISDLITSREDQMMVSSVIAMAKSFGLTTVAEGVENALTVDALGTYGADFAQGYYFGRPAPVLVRSAPVGNGAR